jgi:CrcB protein
MSQVLLVFLGGGIGATIRHLMNLGVARIAGTAFPWSTAIINVTGSFLMGVLVAFFAFRAGAGWSQHVRLFATTGILGGYTTFSTFSLDAALLWERGATGQAAAYVLGSVVLALIGIFAGLWLVRSLA